MGITRADLRREIAEYSESWPGREHQEAMECRDVEEHIAKGVVAYHRIHEADAAWSKAVKLGAIDFDEADATFIGELYRNWMSVADRAIAQVERFEAMGYDVSGAVEFREARQRVLCALSIPLDRVIRSLNRKNVGPRRTLGELRDGLQGRI